VHAVLKLGSTNKSIPSSNITKQCADRFRNHFKNIDFRVIENVELLKHALAAMGVMFADRQS
jgi:hypothetical protein